MENSTECGIKYFMHAVALNSNVSKNSNFCTEWKMSRGIYSACVCTFTYLALSAFSCYIYMQGILHIPWCQDCTVHPCISNTHAVGRKPVYTVTLWGLTSLFFNFFFNFNFGFRLDYSRGRIMAREVAVMISIGNECKSKCCVLMVSELQLVHSTNPQVWLDFIQCLNTDCAFVCMCVSACHCLLFFIISWQMC